MRLFFIRDKHQQAPDAGQQVMDKSLEQVRIEAQKEVRETLCHDCLDQRCRTGSLCKAFLTFTDAVAWEILARRAENN